MVDRTAPEGKRALLSQVTMLWMTFQWGSAQSVSWLNSLSHIQHPLDPSRLPLLWLLLHPNERMGAALWRVDLPTAAWPTKQHLRIQNRLFEIQLLQCRCCLSYSGLYCLGSSCCFAMQHTPTGPVLSLLAMGGHLDYLRHLRWSWGLRFRQLSAFSTASEILWLLPCPVLMKMFIFYSSLQFFVLRTVKTIQMKLKSLENMQFAHSNQVGMEW